MLPNPRPSSWITLFIKRFIYSQLAVIDGLMILIGRQDPKLTFSVLPDPSSIYINFEIRPDKLEEFVEYINLAEGLPLAPIVCLEGEEPRYYITLNIYEVSGLVSGARAEWSTYIADRDGVPRYMVLEAQAAKGSMDPVNIVTRAGRVTHQREDSKLKSEVYTLDGQTFTSTLELDAKSPVVKAKPQWIAANDYIYWRNGVCDRAWYNADMFDATIRAIPEDACEISDNTHWARFLAPTPTHVLQLDGGLELMVSPWYNV